MKKPDDFDEIANVFSHNHNEKICTGALNKLIDFNDILIKPQDIVDLPSDDYTTVVLSKEGTNPEVCFFKKGKGTETETNRILLTDELKRIGKMIIPFNGRYFVYSLEFGIVVSAFYDKIIFIAEEGIFHVEYRCNTRLGTVNLFGELDSEGHLIGDTLYAAEINGAYDVDEHNLDNSIAMCILKIEKDMLKRKKKKVNEEYVAFEYDNWSLKRNRKEKKSN